MATAVRRLGLLVALIALGVTALAYHAAPASAGGRIIECGNYGLTRHGLHMHWTYRQIFGATPAANLTTRHVRCHRARRFALGYRNPRTYRPRWHCHQYLADEFADVRCTRGRKVIHWQAGS
jgi:hypothetical protein